MVSIGEMEQGRAKLASERRSDVLGSPTHCRRQDADAANPQYVDVGAMAPSCSVQLQLPRKNPLPACVPLTAAAESRTCLPDAEHKILADCARVTKLTIAVINKMYVEPLNYG